MGEVGPVETKEVVDPAEVKEEGAQPNGDQGGGARQVQTSVDPFPLQQFDSPPGSDMLSSLVSSSSDEEEEGVLQVRIPDGGSCQQHVDLLLAGVPVRGVVDIGSDITIVVGDMFRRVAAAARLKKKQLLKPDKVPRT